MCTHTAHFPVCSCSIMGLGSVPALLQLINSGFNSAECWVQTRQPCVLKHAPSSLIIGMCVLEKLMNKSVGGDCDWCVRNKQAATAAAISEEARRQPAGERMQTCQHMCPVSPRHWSSDVVCEFNILLFLSSVDVSLIILSLLEVEKKYVTFKSLLSN